jgi:F0F1-type ATP synthase assembly protein I
MIPKTDRRNWAKAGRAASAGYFIVVALLLGAGAGHWVDGRYGTQPWGLLGGFAVGMLAAAKELWTIARTTHLGAPPNGSGPADPGGTA